MRAHINISSIEVQHLLTKTFFESRYKKQKARSMIFDTKSQKVEVFANSPQNRKNSWDYIIVHGQNTEHVQLGWKGFISTYYNYSLSC